MLGTTKRLSKIGEYILKNVKEHPRDINRITAIHFGMSRQNIALHTSSLIDNGLLEATGNTKAREYKLKSFINRVLGIPVTPDLEEHIVWREDILPRMLGIADNVVHICQYGFEEMLNNVRVHSDADEVIIKIERNAIKVKFIVSDNGVGIFKKIQSNFNYDDPRHALLELAKGKLTTSPEGHTGEGVFFTSRMFNEFEILSGTLYYGRVNTEDDWLIETEERPNRKGTAIFMTIRPDAEQTMEGIFDKYAVGRNRDFSRTHVPVKLARYETEQLLSRSQARRVLARFDRFKEVMLDFRDVELIGQAFADEIFRVYQNEHPETNMRYVNASLEIKRMIKRVEQNPT